MNIEIPDQDVLDSKLAVAILKRINDRQYYFVFPSQIAADSWAQAIFRHPEVDALEPGRFLSWDRFLAIIREKPHNEAMRPADHYTRYLWACSTIKENAEKHFLRALVKLGFDPPRRYSSWLASIASRLGLLEDIFRRGNISESHNAEIQDFITLAEKYRIFLERNNLFEESNLPLCFPQKNRFILFGASTYKDIYWYRGVLEKSGCVEYFNEILTEPGRNRKLYRFENFRTEARWVFANIRSMLDNGKNLGDFAISVPALTPDMKAYLSAFAHEYDVSITFRFGEKLSSSPFGLLLNLIATAIDEALSRQSVEALARQTLFVWKQPKLINKLMEFSRIFSIPWKSAGKRYMNQVWKMTFRDAHFEEKELLYDFFLMLQKKLIAIDAAASFQSLREALFDFRVTFLDDSELSEHSEKLLARIFEELVSLEHAAQLLKGANLQGNPFERFLDFLETVQYAADSRDVAVSVYPYVSGSLNAAPVHFVLDASQDAIDSAQKFPSLPESIKKMLPNDTSYESFMLQSFDCVNAIYCFANTALSGFCVPHPWFSAEHFQTVFVNEDSMLNALSFLSREKKAWIENQPENLQPLTMRQHNAALGIFNSEQGDQLLPPPLFYQLETEPKQTIAKDNVKDCITPALHGTSIKINPAALGDYSACPFRWFLSYVARLQNQIPSETLIVGSILHGCIKTIILKINSEQPFLRKEDVQKYSDLIISAIQQGIDYYTRKSGHGTRPFLEAHIRRMKSRLLTYLELEAELQEDGWTVGEFEKSFEKHFEKLSIIFNGRTDRLMFRQERSGTTCLLIDYKKKDIPQKKSLMLDEKTGQLMELQIPGYILLLTEAGFQVVSAFYYSIENARKQVVLGNENRAAAPNVQSYFRELEALRAMLEKTSEGIWSGKITTASPFTKTCSNCEYRPICRANYFSERH